jgi:hypothetical protein
MIDLSNNTICNWFFSSQGTIGNLGRKGEKGIKGVQVS